jgi:toxin ParE1/3/4
VKVTWSAFALADRDSIFSHIEGQNAVAAIAVDERIASTAQRLRDFPESGIVGDTIRILRVLHGAQRWPDELPS